MWVDYETHGCKLVPNIRAATMKQIIVLLLFISAITRSFAQSPQAFPYQAVARDINGNLLANKNISLRFSVLDSSNNGASIYQETHNTTTNLLGLFNLYIGQGVVTSGTFANINWALGAKFIKVELDTSGSNSFTLMGISQLMSVPYALHAGSNLHSTGPVIDPGHPTTNSWTQKANAGNISRSMCVGFSIGQSGYIGTGSSGGGLIGLDDLWEYNVSSNTWTQKANFPGGGRKGAVAFSIRNKGYVGSGESGLPPATYVNYDLWEYDPALNAWTQKTNLPASARKFATGFSIGTKGYIGLGTDGSSDLNDFWEYDSATDTWTQKATYNGNGKRFVASFSVANKGYIGLGTDINGNFYNDWNEYDPATNAWNAKTTFPSAGRHSTTGFTMNNKGYVGTGTDGNSYLNEFWEYNPANDTWTPRAPFSGMARINAVGFSIGNKGYIGTGDNSEMWEYMDDNVSGTAYSSAANIGSNNLVTDGAWTLYNNHIYNANSGNVGIGTSTPTNKFSVVGNVDVDGKLGIGTTSPTNKLSIVGNADVDGKLGIGTTTPSNKLSVIGNADISGNFGIGTASPTSQLHTTGSVRHDVLGGSGQVAVYADNSGNLSTAKIVTNIANSIVQPIINPGCPGISSIITLAGLPNSISTKEISVKLDISCDNEHFIHVYLVAPNGDVLNLSNSASTSGPNTTHPCLSNITFTDYAPYGWAGVYDFSYSLALTDFSVIPEGNMSSNCGITPTVSTFAAIGGGTINPNGNWTLKVIRDPTWQATLNSWNINIVNMQGGIEGFFPKWGNNKLSPTSLICERDGKIGIGTQNPTSELHINGGMKTSGNVGIGMIGLSPTARLSVNGTADKPGGGSWAVFSDRRLKNNTMPYNDGLTTLLKINPIKYHYNEILECDTSIEYVGVIAQDIKEIAPYMTHTAFIKGTDYLEVDNSAMTYMIINAIKEINSKYETLNTKYEEQKKQNEYLQKQIQELNAILKK